MPNVKIKVNDKKISQCSLQLNLQKKIDSLKQNKTC